MFESQEDFDKQFPRNVDNPYSAEQLATTKAEKITGWHPQGPVPMPVSYLTGVPGRMNEHRREWNDPKYDNRVNQLADSMRLDGYNPEKPVALEYDNEGNPWIHEGNHRIRAAQKAELEYIPTEIKYLGGAERKVHPFNVHQQYQESKAKMKPTAAKDVQKFKHNKPWYVVQHPGKPTAKHTKLVALPIDYLLTLPGMRDEHKVLTFDTPKVRRMVDICSDREWQRENPVTLNVLNDGKVIIEDGNHRIRAAKLGGKDTFLCKIVYFGGGEEHFDLGKVLDKHASLDLEIYVKALLVEARGYYGVPGPVKVCSGKGCGNRPVGLFCDDCYKKKNEPGFETKKPEDYEVYRKRADFQGKNASLEHRSAWNRQVRALMYVGEVLHSVGIEPFGAILSVIAAEFPEVNKSISDWTKEVMSRIKHNMEDVPSIETDTVPKEIPKAASFSQRADFQGISGDGEVDGESADGEYAGMHDSGLDYGGENDPNKDKERTMIPGQTDGTRAALRALNMFAKYARLLTVDELRELGRKAREEDPELDRLAKAHEAKYANKFTVKEHRQHDHIKESEEEQGKSEGEADDIAWATVNKQKHDAAGLPLRPSRDLIPAIPRIPGIPHEPSISKTLVKSKDEAIGATEEGESSEPSIAATAADALQSSVPAGAAPKKTPSFWERLKPQHQKIIHNLINQLYTPGVDDVDQPNMSMWGNNPPGSHVANLFRAALVSEEVLEALVQIASSNGRCLKCGNTTDDCICLDDTNMSAGYTQDGKQRVNNPVKTKSSLPKELNPNKGLGKL